MHDKPGIPPGIPEERLRACLQEQYDLAPVTLEFLPLGLDANAAVCRAVSAQGGSYAFKVRRGSLYEPSCVIPRYLRDQGIAAVVAPIPSKRNALWTVIGDWAGALYPFIEGNAGWNPAMSDEQWRAVGAALRQIHQVTPPPGGLHPPRHETFDPAEYLRWAREFEAQQAGVVGGDQHQRALRSSWMAHQPAIHTALSSLETLASALRRQSGPRVICHADLHPGNILRNPANEVFLVDWDDVMLAPKERDFLFIGDAPVESAARPDASPFFQGYGETTIDWVALTYYLWERAVQDLIECAKWVFIRDDLGEEAKAYSVRLFESVFSDGGEVSAALAAAAHLPARLR